MILNSVSELQLQNFCFFLVISLGRLQKEPRSPLLKVSTFSCYHTSIINTTCDCMCPACAAAKCDSFVQTQRSIQLVHVHMSYALNHVCSVFRTTHALCNCVGVSTVWPFLWVCCDWWWRHKCFDWQQQQPGEEEKSYLCALWRIVWFHCNIPFRIKETCKYVNLFSWFFFPLPFYLVQTCCLEICSKKRLLCVVLAWYIVCGALMCSTVQFLCVWPVASLICSCRRLKPTIYLLTSVSLQLFLCSIRCSRKQAYSTVMSLCEFNFFSFFCFAIASRSIASAPLQPPSPPCSSAGEHKIVLKWSYSAPPPLFFPQ